MATPIRGKGGKFAGSIGDGRDRPPTPGPSAGTTQPGVADGETEAHVANIYDQFRRLREVENLVHHETASVWVDGSRVDLHLSEPVAGPTAGTVVFLHGWGLGPKSYEVTTDAFAQRGYRVITPGLPGFGGSEFLPDSTPQQDIVPATAEHMYRALEAYDLPKPWRIVGHSFGGGLATSIADQHPEAAQELVLLSPIGGDTGSGSWVRALASLGGEAQHSTVERFRDALPAFAKGFGRMVSIGIAAKSTDLTAPLQRVARRTPVTLVTSDTDKVTPVGNLSHVEGLQRVTVTGSHGWLLSPEGADTAADIVSR